MAEQVVEEKKKTGTGTNAILDTLTGIAQLGSMFSPTTTKQTTGPSTQTTGLDISQEGIDNQVQQILQGVQGLAQVSSGQKGAGLYNSSTNQMLTNDLTARTAGQAAQLGAKTVTTNSGATSTTVTPPKADLASTLLTAGAGVLANKVLKDGTIENVLGSVGDAIGGIFGGTSDAVTSAVGNVSSGIDFGGAIGGAGIDLGGFSDAFGDVGGLGDLSGGFPVLGIAGDLLGGKPEDALGDAAGYLIGNAIVPGVGGPIGSLLMGNFDIGDILGGIGGGLFGGSVVCTELNTQGLMSKELYANDIAYAVAHMSEETLNGYRYWGIPLVKLMRKSKLVTKISAYFAINRAHYIASIYGNVSYDPKKAKVGKRINAIGVPICNLIAKLTTPKDFNVLYAGE